ncbi:MAG: LysM peptidoglycan-binding domain-containing protein [Prosthecobacter sp.]
MLAVTSRILLALVMTGGVSFRSLAQTVPVPAVPPAKPRIEPGLEMAVKWKWWVLPSDEKNWGFALPETPHSAATSGVPTASISPVAARPDSYEVKRGDALVIIARKFAMSVDQLKAFNNLTKDTIQIGQVLKIPTLKELYAMVPPPEPEPKTSEKSKPKTVVKAPPVLVVSKETESVLLQVFLDREHFSTGPIDGNPGTVFEKALELYRSVHEDVPTTETLRQKAITVAGEPFTRYTLKPEDFRFIAPEMAETLPAIKSARSSKSKQAPALPAQTYEELVAAPLLAYRTPWEFVAERFHCEETFLRSLNAKIKSTPTAGIDFQVPNVIPFEIEKAFDLPLQPAADASKPVTAAIVGLSRLEIYQGVKLVAAMPLCSARPDLRGRGSWTVLDVIPRPRLATKQEPKTADKPKLVSAFVVPTAPEVTPASAPVLSTEQYLAAGPNNPLGILWINLAKAKSTTPLPYGLHGTSIPGRMKTQESIGGLRMANWDIVRIVRLLPSGTALQWK